MPIRIIVDILGVNTVRIPVGYWILETEENQGPFVRGAAQFLDAAFDMAAVHNIRVVISLHAAPGSQNGFDHSAPRDR